MNHTVLTVIEDPLVRANVRYTLTRDGLRVVESSDHRCAAELVRAQNAHLVLVDLHEPLALELCRRLRREEDVPVLVQLPCHDEHSEWMCLQAGAGDVINRTTSKRVMLARAQALLQRQAEVDPLQTIRVGPLLLDMEARTVEVHGIEVTVTKTEFDLLALLMAQPRRVHVRADLVHTVWGAHYPEHILETHLSRLRKKIRLAGGPVIGEAVRGVGYRLGVEAQRESLVS